MKIPSEELGQFVNDEQQYQMLAMKLLDYRTSVANFADRVLLEPQEDDQLVNQYISSNVVSLTQNPQGETGHFAARVDGLFQTRTVLTRDFSTELHNVSAAFSLRLVTNVDAEPEIFERPLFLAIGCLHGFLKPFSAQHFGLPLNESLERAAHSPEARKTQRTYGKWLELMDAATIG